jgi:alkaline phosphatase
MRARGFIATGLIACLALALVLVRGGGTTHAATPTGTSVIVLIGDGMGPAQRAATQLARYGLETPQPMDALPVSGSIFTQSTKPITDSAAGATAIATGVKTNNGYVGVGPDGERVETLLEIARDAGKSTGLVEDSDVTNATTGAFGAHVKDRDQARQMPAATSSTPSPT